MVVSLWKGAIVVAPVVLAITCYLCWHASIDWHDLAGDGLPITVLVGSVSYQDSNGKCAQLGLLEEKATRNPTSKEADDYEAALIAWQQDHQGVQPLCRSDSLGRSMSNDAARMIEAMGSQIDDPWLNSVGEGLVEHLQNKEDCMFFWDRFVPRKFFPTIFHWGEYVDDALVDRLLNDTSENADLYSRLMFNMPPYGAPQIRLRERPQGRYRMAKVEMLAHVRALIRAHKGTLGVKQIVEFGGGTGQLAALFREFLGGVTVPPTHFIYDFAPMNLVQRYWLAYSGFPSYLGWNLDLGTESFISKIVLECSMPSLQTHLDAQELKNSLFWASFSLTEADLKTRDQFWPIIKQFGVIFISYWANWNGLENDKYLKAKKEEEGLQDTHNILIWRIPDRSTTGGEHVQNSFYFLAVRKDRTNAEILCVREVGCSQETIKSPV